MNQFFIKVMRRLRRIAGTALAFIRYRMKLRAYKEATRYAGNPKGRVLFVGGPGMNTVWAQMWTYLCLAFMSKQVEPCALVLRNQWTLKRYFGLVNAKIFLLENVMVTEPDPFDRAQIERCMTVDDWKDLSYKNMPVGQMVMSTYCRYFATGLINPTDRELKKFAEKWIPIICRAYEAARKLYRTQKISGAVFTETFIEEYGGFYYAALESGLDVIKTSGTVRDNAIVVQRRSLETQRLHHAALTHSAWDVVRQLPDFEIMKKEVEKNFEDRYSNKWYRSMRNQKGTRNMNRQEGRSLLGISEEQKVVIVFSHILYDSLFHFGDELFQDYATWLIETIKIAIKNPNVVWYIKLHPSNLWRGEFQTVLGGQYEEERIISQYIGNLPDHVRLVYADTPISPYGWYQVADYGISVRGTSGLEMACLGKPVITAGSGRYEGKGFTIDPETVDEYRAMLLGLPAVAALTPEQTELAIRYAHGLFNMKPFTLTSLEPRVVFGKRIVSESDDISYEPCALKSKGDLPEELKRFAAFIADKQQIDLLTAR